MFINSIFFLAGAAVLLAQDTRATVSGEIRDASGVAISFGEAELRLQAPPNTLFSVGMKEDGRFNFRVLPAGVYTLSVSILGVKPLKVKSIVVASGEQKILPPLTIEAAPFDAWFPIATFEPRADDQQLGNLSGRVMRDARRGLVGATVRLFCEEALCGETKTDSKGDFIFLDLQPRDDYTIRVTRSGYYPWWSDYRVQAGYDATYGAVVMRRRVRLSRAASTVR